MTGLPATHILHTNVGPTTHTRGSELDTNHGGQDAEGCRLSEADDAEAPTEEAQVASDGGPARAVGLPCRYTREDVALLRVAAQKLRVLTDDMGAWTDLDHLADRIEASL